jgi:hypothetical protein
LLNLKAEEHLNQTEKSYDCPNSKANESEQRLFIEHSWAVEPITDPYWDDEAESHVPSNRKQKLKGSCPIFQRTLQERLGKQRFAPSISRKILLSKA